MLTKAAINLEFTGLYSSGIVMYPLVLHIVNSAVTKKGWDMINTDNEGK